jgi:hypothetical protein
MVKIKSFFGKTNDVENVAKSIIYNKYVLYIVFFIALLNLLYAAVENNYLYCALFVLIGFLTSFFNKNMTVILTITIACATVIGNIILGKKMQLEEGLSNIDPGDDENVSANMIDSSKGNSDNRLIGELINRTVPNTSGNTVAGNASSQPSSTLVASLQTQAIDLQDAQKNIIKGFETISPYMDKAENIINSIQTTAQTIQNIKKQQTSE